MYANEGRLQAAIQKAILDEYPTAWIFHPVGGPYQEVGIPDLLLCIQGLLIGMEIKHQKPGESEEYTRSRVTATQRRQITRIIEAGGMAGAVLTVEEAMDLIVRAFKNERRKS